MRVQLSSRLSLLLAMLGILALASGCTRPRGGGGGGGDDDDDATADDDDATADDDDATADDDDATAGDGVDILGGGTHSMNNLDVDVMIDSGAGLNIPRDLEFHPQVSDELWVVNRGDNSSVILQDAGSGDATTIYRGNTGGSSHFLAQPSALAFADDGTWASIHETDDFTQGTNGTPEDFMGPTLWTDDLNVYDGGHAGHLDMLHNSPNGMGIAWQEDRTFWIFDGYHDSLTRYFFNNDHGPGGADHSDGEIERHMEGEVRWRENIPSHMEYDHDDDYVYVADTGNNRIAVFDARSGSQGSSISPNYDGVSRQVEYTGGDCWTLIDGEAVPEMGRPSGLALHDGMIFTNDNRTGRIWAFDMDGTMLDYLDTGLPDGSLMGMEFDEAGNLWLVDAVNDEVLRIRKP